MQPETIFQIIVIIYSIILHEIAHGYAAYYFGDRTAYYQNRLTLNPLPHVDLVGSVLVPVTLVLSGSSILAGWAKPVPVAEHALNPYKLGSFCVSVAGVFVNFLIAMIFILVGSFTQDGMIKNLCFLISITNLGLCIFNLIPLPPADGYRIASIFMNYNLKRKAENFINQNFLLVILGSLFFATILFRMIFPYIYNFTYLVIF